MTLPAPISEPDAAFADLTEGKHDPGQQVDRLPDEDHITSESIAGGVVLFWGAWGFEDKRVRCERLTAEHRTVVWDGGFKAFGIDAPVRELTLFLARFLCAADAGDVAEDVSESAAEDVTFVAWHLERFLDGVGEAVLREAEVLEHEDRVKDVIFLPSDGTYEVLTDHSNLNCFPYNSRHNSRLKIFQETCMPDRADFRYLFLPALGSWDC